MSLFPRHLCVGQSLTIHVRVAPSVACFPFVQTQIRDPSGKTVFEDSRQLAATHPEPPRERLSERELGAGLCESPPLLFVAEYLREEAEARTELIRVLQDVRASTHWYRYWTVPEGAALGCYQVDIALWVGGRKFNSGTALIDKFYVEQLSLESTETLRGKLRAGVRNHSPQPVKARLHEYQKNAQNLSATVRVIELDAGGVTEIDVDNEYAVLMYAEDAASLWLHGDSDPVYVRNQTCAWMHSREASVVITSPIQNKTYTLRSEAREVWLAAHGPTRSSELKGLSAEAFHSLVNAGLLRKL